jgi:hypothetical protein
MQYRKPSLEAERRWQTEEARFRRKFVVTGLSIAATIVLTWITAKLGMKPLAVACSLALFGAIGWTIYLIVASRRAFTRIMMDDGLSRKEAAREALRRYGG